MATSSPFLFLANLAQSASSLAAKFQPPAWAVDETQQRLVLLLNHILMQEPQAMARLARVKAKVIRVRWRQFNMTLTATPAGLLDRASEQVRSDLTLTVVDESPLSLLQTVFTGNKPAVSIEGDVQLAAEVNWLVEHVRWDVEEDVARLMGDAPAHALGSVVKQISSAIRGFIVTKTPNSANNDAGGSAA